MEKGSWCVMGLELQAPVNVNPGRRGFQSLVAEVESPSFVAALRALRNSKNASPTSCHCHGRHLPVCFVFLLPAPLFTLPPLQHAGSYQRGRRSNYLGLYKVKERNGAKWVEYQQKKKIGGISSPVEVFDLLDTIMKS